jgi:hypothetical protein
MVYPKGYRLVLTLMGKDFEFPSVATAAGRGDWPLISRDEATGSPRRAPGAGPRGFRLRCAALVRRAQISGLLPAALANGGAPRRLLRADR